MDFFNAINQTGVPKAFWYVVSFILLAIVFGVFYLLHRAQSISIEFNHTKVTLDTQRSKLDEVAAALQLEIAALQERVESTPLADQHSLPVRLTVDRVSLMRSRLADIRKQLTDTEAQYADHT